MATGSSVAQRNARLVNWPKEEHCKNLREVFARLHKASLAINLPKSEFFASEFKFLGHIVDASGIRPSPKHTAGYEITLPRTQRKKYPDSSAF